MPNGEGVPEKRALAGIAQQTRREYAERVAGRPSSRPWWTAVIITAGSERQADWYRWEIHRRQERGGIPGGVPYLVASDPGNRRIGSAGATINALRALAAEVRTDLSPAWWSGQRVFMIHAGGDSRRLPQYSLSGKLFSVLPVKTPWGEASTVFDEMLALSTGWVERLGAGLVVGAGDVLPAFDAAELNWNGPGICGVAMRLPAELGTRHGVYVTDEEARVYAFLRTPSLAELRAAGGILEGGRVALDVGLLRFAPEVAARLTAMPDTDEAIDLYQHFTMVLTGQWTPGPGDSPALHAVAGALRGVPFSCSLVDGDFTHVGTTRVLQKLLTEETEFSALYATQQRIGASRQPGLRSSGVVIDSVLAGGGEIGPGAVVIECNLSQPVRAAAGTVLHGLEEIPEAVEIPEDTVVHQVPVAPPDGTRGVVIRVYGVGDDPKSPASAWTATWFGRPMLDELRNLGMHLHEVWPGLPAAEWTLWNAQLFPVTTVNDAWACARWLLRISNGFSVERWRELSRMSLAGSAQCADGAAVQAAHSRRLRANWQAMAVSLAMSGADIRPLLVHAPGITSLAETARQLRANAESARDTAAAQLHYAAGLFYAQAGLAGEAGEARAAAFAKVQSAVQSGAPAQAAAPADHWRQEQLVVEGPARIDMGGGWSDTPPFCLDWGGSVLNMAVELNGAYPIRTTLRRISEPVIHCHSGEDGAVKEYRDCGEILAPAFPGDPFSIPRTALRMTGIFRADEPLEAVLERMGGGLEIRTAVNLPMGSGLGTSSILAATMLRAFSEIQGHAPDLQRLSDDVMRLEQLMTTGGGWQDQAGGIFPGGKLVVSGPGAHQRLRVQPLAWTAERAAEFENLMVLYYTGIRRIARDLLQQVVGSYLARETATVQVLHSIKTLAVEMTYAMQEAEWDYLGELLDRHWTLNQVLDPNTTNAPINALLAAVRPYIRGAKLAGAGGGGFLMLLARSVEAAAELRRFLSGIDGAGEVYEWRIARDGLRMGNPASMAG